MVIGRQKKRERGINSELSLDSVNKFFRDVALTSDHQPSSKFVPDATCESTSFHFKSIQAEAVEVALKHLDICKSTGPDGLSAKFLREITADIAVPLTKLYNLSLRTATTLNEWKRSNITPVHKSGPQNNRSNFHPIPVVSIVAKILEKFVVA